MNSDKKLEKKIAELKAENEKLKHDLIHDFLTGLKTRKYFEERMKEIISSLENSGREKRKERFRHFSVLFCDIDDFKKINDTLGHDGGDKVLKKVSKIISGKIRAADIVCRWAGDEIAVGLLGANEDEAVKIAEKIRIAVEKEMKDKNVSISMGVADYKEGLNGASIVNFADQAMYLAKKEGKNKVKAYSGVLNMGKETE